MIRLARGLRADKSQRRFAVWMAMFSGLSAAGSRPHLPSLSHHPEVGTTFLNPMLFIIRFVIALLSLGRSRARCGAGVMTTQWPRRPSTETKFDDD